jgi:DNA-binding response OmpR family regulator
MNALILVAEDERDIREFLAVALQVSGFNVVEARNGEEAVDVAKDRRPDLILLDIRMPKLNGYQACETLKSTPYTRDIPIVFLSAFASESDIEMGLTLGAEEYLTKPIDPCLLTQRVSEVLQRARA